MTNRASEQVLAEKKYEAKEDLFSVGFACKFHPVDGAYQFLRCVTDSNIIVLALTYLLCEVSPEISIPFADEFRSIE